MAKARKFEKLGVSMTRKEYEKVKEGFAASTCRTISEYARKLIFGRKITVCYRNRAFDDFMEEAIRLRKALVLFCGQGGFDEREKMNVLQKVEEIRSIVVKISETCSQK